MQGHRNPDDTVREARPMRNAETRTRTFALRSFALIAAVLCAVGTLISLAVSYNRIYLREQGVAPNEISVINQDTLTYQLYPRDGALAQKLLPKAYGLYAPFVKQGRFPLSIDRVGEFTLPPVKVDDVVYLLRESPTLRYRLWQERRPQLLLLGSSILFEGFNRTLFYDEFPDQTLIDFTMGNNTPDKADFMLRRAVELGLRLDPGAVVIYGINDFELISYYGANWGYLRDAIDYQLGLMPYSKVLATWLLHSLGMQAYRDHLWSTLRDYAKPLAAVWATPAVPGAAVPAGPEALVVADNDAAASSCARREIDIIKVYFVYIDVPQDCAGNVEDLSRYLLAQVPKGLGILDVSYSDVHIRHLLQVKQLVTSWGAKFVLVKMPTSNFARARSPSYDYHFNRLIGGVITQVGATYYDASDFDKVGINEANYLWSHDRFDPEHLNFDGSRIFTRYVLDHVYRPLLAAGRLP
jgi:hypothetical protein